MYTQEADTRTPYVRAVGRPRGVRVSTDLCRKGRVVAAQPLLQRIQLGRHLVRARARGRVRLDLGY